MQRKGKRGARPRPMGFIWASLLTLQGLLTILSGCGYDGPLITVDELNTRLSEQAPTITVVDVRSEALFLKGHVPGAMNIPLERLQKNTDAIAGLKDDVAVICTCGKGALEAAKKLRAASISVILVQGGYKEWTASGYPLATDAE